MYIWGWRGAECECFPKLAPFKEKVIVHDVALGAFHVLTIGSYDGRKYVYAWGQNDRWQLGNGSKNGVNIEYPTIVDKIGDKSVVCVEAGESCSCVLTS